MEGDLEELFGKYGKPERVDHKQGFGVVSFVNGGEADEAERQLQGKDLFGSSLFIEPAKERNPGRFPPIQNLIF